MKRLSLTLSLVSALLLTGCINYYYPPQSYPGGPEYAARDNLFPSLGQSSGTPAQPASYYPYSSLDYFYLGQGYGYDPHGWSRRAFQGSGWGYDPWYGFSNPWMSVYPYPTYQYAWYSPIHYHYHYHDHHYAWHDPYWYERYPTDDRAGLSLDKPDWGVLVADDGTDPANRQVRDARTGDRPPNDFEGGDNAAFREYNDPGRVSLRAMPVSTSGAPMWIRSPQDNKPGLSRTHSAASPDDGANVHIISSGTTTRPAYSVVSATQPVPIRAPDLAVNSPASPATTVRILQPADLGKLRTTSSRSPGGASRTHPVRGYDSPSSRARMSSNTIRAPLSTTPRSSSPSPRSRPTVRASSPRAVSPSALGRSNNR